MKTKLDSISRLILIAIMLLSIMAFTSVYKLKRGTVKVNVLKPEKVKITTTIDSSILPEIVIKDHQLFLNDLGHQESGNR
jgi:hypothetical protein